MMNKWTREETIVAFNLYCKIPFKSSSKTHPMAHQDIGQRDMYVRMYDDIIQGPDDNPTIGILLCTDTDKTVARYSVLNGSEQLFATKYMTYLPTEEELRREIEQQKANFMLNNDDSKENV